MLFSAPFSNKTLARTGIVTVIMALLLTWQPATFAQDTIDPKTVVARVNGVEIIQADIAIVEDLYGPQLQQMPESARRPLLVRSLVDLILFANAAGAAKLGDSDDFQRRMTFLRRQALREQYLIEVVEKSVSESEVRARYEEDVKGFKAQDEVRARHILVKTEDEAKDIKASLDKGEDFATLAQSKSTGPSGAQGGDLGYFTRETMVKPFADAAFSLAKDEISAPVQTRFGWHVIKLEDKRKTAPPSFDSVKADLRQALYGEKLEAAQNALREKATIDILDPSAKMPVQEEDADKKPTAQ